MAWSYQGCPPADSDRQACRQTEKRTQHCASTKRRKAALMRFRSERSASGIQIGKAMGQSSGRLDLIDWTTAERPILIAQPSMRHPPVAVRDRIKRAEQPDEQNTKFKRLGAFLKLKFALPHPGCCRFRHAQNNGKILLGNAEPFRSAHHRRGRHPRTFPSIGRKRLWHRIPSLPMRCMTHSYPAINVPAARMPGKFAGTAASSWLSASSVPVYPAPSGPFSPMPRSYQRFRASGETPSPRPALSA